MVVVLVVLLLPQVTFADAYSDAEAAYNRGDYKTAFRGYKRLANQGHARAQSSLGFMYGKGQGVPQDYKEAVTWFRKAANQRCARAHQSNLETVPGNLSDIEKRFSKEFIKRDNQRCARDQFNLGRMYAKGREYVVAYMWVNLAASEGDEKASQLRDAIEKIMTPSQIAEAQKLAREWKPSKK